MARVLDQIKATTGVRLYPVRGVCVDSDDPQTPQDSEVDASKIKAGMLAERDAGPFPVNVTSGESDPARGYDRRRSLFEYFLDGTRRTFLVAELATSSQRYLPVLAGQISAAVVRRERETGRVQYPVTMPPASSRCPVEASGSIRGSRRASRQTA